MSPLATVPYPVTVSTGHYTLDQIEGEACAVCGRPFQPSNALMKIVPGLPDAELYRHIKCPTGGAK